MDFRQMSDGINLDKGHHEHGPPTPSWSSVEPLSHSMILTGDNGAGDGGDGLFSGTVLDSPVAIYKPIDIAAAPFHGAAHAHQSNVVALDQDAIQMAGVGGHGGDVNAAIGGNVSSSGFGNAFSPGWLNSAMVASGDNHAGNGGDGYSYGSLVHASFALYEPVNIAVAGYNSSAYADQTNSVDFNQSALQMAGIGGHGGDGNAALGGSVDALSSGFGFGSDMIDTGANSAGNGGNGHFAGELIDIGIAIYAPINIAISGYNSTADAHQINNVSFDQSAIQIAGIGGDGGHGNLALGGGFAEHLLSDLHLLG
jgi:hypothetical protein